MNKTIAKVITALALVGFLTNCNKPEPSTPDKPDPKPETETETTGTKAEYKAVNTFAKNFFNDYYLWTRECSSKLDKWKDTDDPIKGYKNYKHEADRWGFVTDDYASMFQTFEGVSKTPGMYGYFTNYYDTLAFIPKIVYKDSPAAKAGIKRGDIFTGFDGKLVMCRGGKLTESAEAEMNDFYHRMYSGTVTLRYSESQNTVKITAVEMYEDPVVCHKVFDFDGKKVGYLFYDAFVMDSINPLLQVFREFESAGVSELILDLRYNGGGDVFVENLIGSVLAPRAEVEAGSIFSTRVYNTALTQYYKKNNPEELSTPFATEFQLTEGNRKYMFNVFDINLDIKKLYVIYTGNSASASEGLIVGLGPYLDIELFGQQSYGKYCTCYLLSGEAWYKAYKDDLSEGQYNSGMKYAKNWGCYVTVARFADKNGVTGNYPDGFPIPEANQVEDEWREPYQFGDPKEKMLAKVLHEAGYSSYVSTETKAADQGSSHTIFLDTRLASRPVWGLDLQHFTFEKVSEINQY